MILPIRIAQGHGVLKASSLVKSSISPLSSKSDLKTTGLISFHRTREARLEPFAGYLMPIVYKGETITSEHLQTRVSASAFDVSHMLQTTVSGKDRCKFIESLTVADLETLPVNRCSLSVFTNERGGIIDDCIIGKRQDHLVIVSNASNANKIWTVLNSHVGTKYDAKLKRLDEKCLIAFQGPKSVEVLEELAEIDLSGLDFMSVADMNLKGIGSCQVTRCGYTGEDGFEISVDKKFAESLMNKLCENAYVKPAGLGARNTLRLEAGLCLHGNDMTEETTPIEAGLNWIISKRRRLEGGFPGFTTIMRQLKDGSSLKRCGMVGVGDGPAAREGYEVMDEDKETVLGKVTSGSFSPTLRKNLAMAYIPTEVSKTFGKVVFCKVRGKYYEYRIAKMPFLPSKYYIIKK